MYEKFGFARQEDGSYEFRLFVPDSAIDRTQYVRGGPCRIVEVRVVGDFQDKIEKRRRNWNYDDGLALSERDHPNIHRRRASSAKGGVAGRSAPLAGSGHLRIDDR